VAEGGTGLEDSEGYGFDEGRRRFLVDGQESPCESRISIIIW
jgi:hypothetical protein